MVDNEQLKLYETFTNMNFLSFNKSDAIFEESNLALDIRGVVKVLTNEQRSIIDAIFYVAISGFMGSFGIAANIINIVIFYKHGFNSTANIAFFGLAVSDLLCLIFLVWASVSMNPILILLGVPWVPIEIMYFSAGWPHLCFCRITSYITVYITGERYLSIALPMKIKEIVTRTRTTVIICLIYFVNIISVVPEWVTSYIGMKFVRDRNITLLGLIFTESRKNIEGICFVIHSIISMASFFGVVFFTIALTVKLKQSAQVRNELTSGKDKKGALSVRDKKAVKMIVLIATILIICYIPGAMCAMTIYVVGPEFNIQGGYINICASVWGIAFSFQSINSSINIFLYCRMSSKYKQTFNDLFTMFTVQKNR